MKKRYLTHAVLLLSMLALNSNAIAKNETGFKDFKDIKAAHKTSPAVIRGSLTSVIHDSSAFTTLTRALRATGLDRTLGGSDQFTVFAPTNEAFEALPAETFAELMLPENVGKLRMLLLYHVVEGKVLAAELTGADMETVSGGKINIDMSFDRIVVNGTKVDSEDVAATNGVIHRVSEILFPEVLDEFASLKD